MTAGLYVAIHAHGLGVMSPLDDGVEEGARLRFKTEGMEREDARLEDARHKTGEAGESLRHPCQRMTQVVSPPCRAGSEA